MPVRVVLRTGRSQSPFRRLLHALVRAPGGDSALLCSGYIWEQPSSSPGYKVLDDLLPELVHGCNGGVVITVAGKLGYTQYEDFYRNFVKRLRQAGLKVQALVAPKRNWHAKIAVRVDGTQPIAALIGSSNLTAPAYREGYGNWNFEADVSIWPQRADLTSHFRGAVEQGGDDAQVLDLVLDPTVTQPAETEQIQRLYESVMNAELEQL
jgi:hypothetical protein